MCTPSSVAVLSISATLFLAVNYYFCREIQRVMRLLVNLVATLNRMEFIFQTIVVAFLLQRASTAAHLTEVVATVTPFPRTENIHRSDDVFHEMDIFPDSRRLLASDNTGRSTNISSNETEILLRFRRAVTSDPYGALDSWNATSNPNICRWAGVTCDSSNKVSSLNLSNYELEGSISPFLGQMSFLSSISLSGNSFVGPLPSSFGMLRYLRHLDMSRNKLTMGIPVEITNCSSLVYLNLSSNNLSGSIPKQFGKLQNISVVGLGGNLLIDSIPRELGNCSSLVELDLSANTLTGTIPQELGRLRTLSSLWLANNTFLSGSIPMSITNCTSLTVLDLSLNNLTGNVLPELGELRKLQILKLHCTMLSGSIPSSLGNLSSLLTLMFGCSPLFYSFITTFPVPITGPIPPDLGRLKNLSYLYMSRTNITGSIPEELGNLPNVETFHISWIPGLTGHIPHSLGNLSSAFRITLEGNGLEGPIPGSLGGIQHLGWLGLRMNRLTGTIPREIGNLTNIYRLLFSLNNLSGPVMSEYGRLYNMRELGLDYNQFSGELPRTLGNLSLLGQLFLSSNLISGPLPIDMLLGMTALYNFSCTNNQVSGPIPKEIGKMDRLEYLNLSSNNLSGSIPATIGSCKDLSTLDVSNNNLTGELPITALESLVVLKDFSVANNSLEGAIPGQLGAFGNITAQSYAGNAGLCGPLLGRNCSSESTRRPHVASWRNVLIYVGCGAAVVVVILGASLTIILLCRRKSPREAGNEYSVNISDENDFKDLPAFRNELKLTMEDLGIATAKFHESNILGKGGQSTVYKAVLPYDDGRTFAVKRMHLDETPLTLSSHGLYQEVRVLSNIKHRNLVKLHGWCARDKVMALLMEYVPNGSLQSHLHSVNKSKGIGTNCETRVGWLGLQARIKIAIGVADGMAYLHHECQNPIIHNDLKPSNILLDNDFNAKVADFGIARFVRTGRLNKEATISALYGTVGYIPPEYATSDKVTTAGDVYSYGVVVLELLTGKRPTDDLFASGSTCLSDWALRAFPNRIADLLDKRLKSDFESNEEQIRWLLRVGLVCTRATPAERPSMHAVQQMLAEISEIGTLRTFEPGSESPQPR